MTWMIIRLILSLGFVALVAPQIVGGTSGMMIGNIVQSLFTRTNNAPLGAAVSVVTMAIVALVATGFVVLAGNRRNSLRVRDDAASA